MASVYFGEEEMLAVLEILALSDDPMFAIDDRHRIVFWNRGAQELYGYTHDEVAGRTCSVVLAGSDDYGNRYCSETCPVSLMARRGESVRPYRLQYRAKSGELVAADVSINKFTMRVSKRMLLVHTLRPAAPAQQFIEEAPVPNAERTDVRLHELTSREVQILRSLAAGQSSTTIATDLGISPLTTRNHIQHIFTKLEVHSRSEAVAFAYRAHIV
jgi:PAS domain S-box-containing protein